MTWSLVRLALARTPEFPEGSDERAYELVLPLLADGQIDAKAFDAAPGRASVQRILPNQGIERGQILRKPSGWAFSYAPGDADDESVFHLENHPLVEGNYVTLAEPDGDALPFRIAIVRPLPDPASR